MALQECAEIRHMVLLDNGNRHTCLIWREINYSLCLAMSRMREKNFRVEFSVGMFCSFANSCAR